MQVSCLELTLLRDVDFRGGAVLKVKTHTIRRFEVLVFAFLVSSGITAFGQNANSGEIKGEVTDSSGAVVEGANVTLLDTATGVTFRTQTNGVGLYDEPSLPTGPYTVTFSKGSFR